MERREKEKSVDTQNFDSLVSQLQAEASAVLKLRKVQLRWEIERKAIIQKWCENEQKWMQEKVELQRRAQALKDLAEKERAIFIEELATLVCANAELRQQVSRMTQAHQEQEQQQHKQTQKQEKQDKQEKQEAKAPAPTHEQKS